MKTTVYYFKVWSPGTDDYVIPQRKSTAERIKNVCRGEIIEGTGEEVDVSALDEQGRYDPSATEKKDA